jgi:hypothetical protein
MKRNQLRARTRWGRGAKSAIEISNPDMNAFPILTPIWTARDSDYLAVVSANARFVPLELIVMRLKIKSWELATYLIPRYNTARKQGVFFQSISRIE